MKPNQDSCSGNNQICCHKKYLSYSKNCTRVESCKSLNMSSKSVPKYLKKVEDKLSEDLKLIKYCDSEIPERKLLSFNEILEVHRKAFQTLIDNTVNYSKLLTDIRSAYENAISARDEIIDRQLLQMRLFGINENKKKIEETEGLWAEKCENMKIDNIKLNLEICKLKNEIAKHESSNLSEYLYVARERDARYTLYFENVALQQQLRGLRGAGGGEAGGEGDPLVARIALERCREQLTATQKKLNKLTCQYVDSVPRSEHDALAVRASEASELLADARREVELWRNKYTKLQALKSSIEEEYNELKERCSELDRAGTPRPHWQICADFIVGGRDRWRELSLGLSSRDTLRALLKELGPAADNDNLEHFDGLGTDASVPPYLRWSGRVRNLRLSRRELYVVLHDMWRARHAPGQTLPMHQYITKYFEERYQQASVRAEWAYNVMARAEQELGEPRVRLWWGAVRGEGGNDKAHAALALQWGQLKEALYKAARDDETITAEEFEKAVRLRFPLKSDADVKSLVDVARKQLKLKLSANDINLDKLFYENEEGFESIDLARELYRQRQIAQDKYIKEVVAELGSKKAGNKLITVDNLKRAFAIVDPAIDHIRMESNVCWAFSVDSCKEENIPPLPLRSLAARLAAGDLERAGPRYKGGRRRAHYK